MDLMRAARLHVPSRTLTIEDVPRPVPGPWQVLVKVAAAGVCMSDVHLIDGSLGRPRHLAEDTVTIGHEVAGTIAELGPEVGGWSIGQRVVLQAGEIRDGETYTRGVDYDGGWADYALASVDSIFALPDSIPFEQAAIIPDAVSTPWSAIVNTAQVRPGEAAGVWGVGGLGSHAIQLLRAVCAYPLVAVDPVPGARARALELGADLALDPRDPTLKDQILFLTEGAGLNAAFDFAGVASVYDQVLGVLAEEGRLVVVGLSGRPLTLRDSTTFSYRKHRIMGHFGSGDDVVPRLVDLVDHGRLDFSRSITDVLPLGKASVAVRRMHTKEGNPLRLILAP
ncbi:zinc-binding dehydrogenase [Frankia sp. CcI49]|uniref:D-arabinose 1-dehydrogenase, Zn-dependent alcohol dehydrogenase family n=1 Tax=Parafrankia irregularis TaxID=795642 RepID=A0A0S4QJ22_9ACTN|nr:zinc-binding dehydrogenase [Frankia sp. R43]MBE3200816.1 zinc-binding dehydrogenase [Parafrankia sp. CH37]ONH61526.1 zinc-binding dehydrogenase [Frankia sp. CcI49]CUU54792.1 D-arabinose 1-dehydrogenase, Zn-dependent alcohol dehydrogenase family [Parafrankia irregularis]